MMNKKAIYHRTDDFTLLQGDCIRLMGEFDFKFDMIFADPPYFLSNGGISVQSGKVVCVDKGEWDKGGSPEHIDQFNEEWISSCREHLKENGTIWVSGTYHNIFSVANKLTQLGFKILNVITWAKTNPPPNISCRYFTYSTEFVIWARKEKKVPHYYNYQLMKRLNDDKQMTDVWRLPAIARWEKSQGKKRGAGLADDSPRLPASHQGYRGNGEDGAAGRYASRLHSRGRYAGLRLAFLRKCVFFDTGMCFLKTGDKDDEWALYPKKVTQ
jgi:DNA modification methylase